MVIGERLRAIREQKDLSQGDVEKRTGLLRCYLSRCENGHTIPSIETLKKWSHALGVSMAELFAGNGPIPKPVVAAAKAPTLNRAAQNALRRITVSLSRMNPRDRVLLVGIAHKLADRK